MRIAMISEHASPLAVLGGVDAGGQNVHVAALARALGRLGHDVAVYTRRDDPGPAPVVELDVGVRVVHVDAGPPAPLPKDELLPFMPEFGRRVGREWCRDGAPDVVHAHFWMSGVAAEHASQMVPVPRVQTFHALGNVKRRHQGESDTSPKQRIAIETRLAGGSDRIVATCSDEMAELVALGAAPDRVDIVPCGVDLDVFGPQAGSESTHRPRIVTLTRLVERKGIEVVLRALPMLPGVEYVVAGGPPAGRLDTDAEAVRLRELARSLGVHDRFELRGAVAHDEVAGLLGSAHVIACTPWYEPFGIVPLEAMACGRPVVASAVGGLLDTIRHGVNGYHVPPCDPEATASAIRRILDDPQLAASMSAAGRAIVEERYGWDRIARDTLEAYRRTTRRRPANLGSGPGHSSGWLDAHVAELSAAMEWVRRQGAEIDRWSERLGNHLWTGGRVLVAGNGGSAAEAQHFTAELVGRYVEERRPMSALCLSSETSSLTAIGNDHGATEVFARQVEAHGRAGDVLVLLSTSGRSPNVLAAAERARELGIHVLALTGRGPNPLATLVDEALCVPSDGTSVVQEIHLLLLHAVCAAVDARVLGVPATHTPMAARRTTPPARPIRPEGSSPIPRTAARVRTGARLA